MKRDKNIYFLNKFGHICGIISILIILLLVSLHNLFNVFYINKYEVVDSFSWVLTIISFVAVLAIFLLIIKFLLKIDYDKKKNFIIIVSIMFVVFVLLQMYSIYSLMVNPSWDFGTIYLEAIDQSTGNYQHIVRDAYFSQYTNNNLILVMVTWIFKLFGGVFNNNFLLLGNVANLIIIDLSFAINILIVNRLFSKKWVVIFIFLNLLCLPLYTYIPIFYTDTFPMIFQSLIVYCYICFLQTDIRIKKIINMVLIGIISLIGFQLKATVIILLVAIIIHIFLKSKLKKSLILTSLIAISFVVTNFGYNHTINKSELFSQLDYERYSLPYPHWIMMGLTFPGGFNPDDFSYTKSFVTKEEKAEANINKIKERIHSYGFVGMAKHLGEKITYVWSDGTYFSASLLKREPTNDDSLGYSIIALDGKYTIYTIYIYNAYHFIVLLLVLSSMIKGFKDKKPDVISFFRLAFFGLFIFLLIWEAKPKYLVNFIPLFYFICLDGLIYFESKVNLNQKKINALKDV